MGVDKRTLVVGVNPNKPHTYAVKACLLLDYYGIDFVPFGLNPGTVAGRGVATSPNAAAQQGPYHTLTLYLNSGNQGQLEEWMLALKPKRILFNPGAENPKLAQLARKAGIETEEACTLVLLNTGQY